VLAEIFSKEDRAYIEEAVVNHIAGRNLAMTIEPNEDRGSPEKKGGRSIVTATHTFDVELRNNGEEELSDLEVEYRVFYKKAERVWDQRGSQKIGKSKRNDSYRENTVKVASIKPRKDESFSTVPLSLVNNRPNRGGPG
jgi:hypothetical protein